MAAGGRGEMAYAAGLGPVGGDTVGVQIPPPALYSLDKVAAWDRVIGGPPTVTFALSTLDGTDIYMYLHGQQPVVQCHHAWADAVLPYAQADRPSQRPPLAPRVPRITPIS